MEVDSPTAMEVDTPPLPTFGEDSVKFGKPFVEIRSCPDQYQETQVMVQGETRAFIISINVEIEHSFATHDWEIAFIQGMSGNEKHIAKSSLAEKIAAFHPFISNRYQMLNDSEPENAFPFYSTSEGLMVIPRGEVLPTTRVLQLIDCPTNVNRIIENLPTHFPSRPDMRATVYYTDIILDLQFISWLVVLRRGNNRSNATLIDRQRFQVNHDLLYIAKTVQWQTVSRLFVDFDEPVGERIRRFPIPLTPPVVHERNIRIPLHALLLPSSNAAAAVLIYPDKEMGLRCFRNYVPDAEIEEVFSTVVLYGLPMHSIVPWEKWKEETIRPGYTGLRIIQDADDMANVSELQPEIPVPDRPPETPYPPLFVDFLEKPPTRQVKNIACDVPRSSQQLPGYVTRESTLGDITEHLMTRLGPWGQLPSSMMTTSAEEFHPQRIRFHPMLYRRYN